MDNKHMKLRKIGSCVHNFFNKKYEFYIKFMKILPFFSIMILKTKSSDYFITLTFHGRVVLDLLANNYNIIQVSGE